MEHQHEQNKESHAGHDMNNIQHGVNPAMGHAGHNHHAMMIATYRKMIQNLIWATGCNIIALPLAAGVLYKQGILLSPAAGAVLMKVSTVVVAINASFLKVKK